MTEQPANIAREAKGIHQSLKELLKKREPFDKEVDFQRKTLRRRYLSLLLTHPQARESKDAETHLWMQTSYAFISSYKQRIHSLDRLMENKLKEVPKQQASRPQEQRNNTHIVERRKLVQRFRQFLSEEEKFWTQLVVRFRRSFSLDEVTPALLSLGLINEPDESLIPESADGIADSSGQSIRHGRNHFQFPDTSTIFISSSQEEKEAWVAIMAKALICLGDINRYRESYNETGGRTKAVYEESRRKKRVRSRRGTPVDTSRQRNYEKAQHCYEQARLLVPFDGNPSHQLAILATYKKDTFMSLVYYYRAICVRTPYDTALDNLNSVLSKSLEQWRTRVKQEKEQTEDLPPRSHIELFKEKIVVLHALWKVGNERGEKRMESLSHRHHKRVSDDFYTFVSERHLPIDVILNSVVIAQGALWKHRMFRSSSTVASGLKHNIPSPPENTSVLMEWYILRHTLDLHRALLEVGIEELKVPPSRDVSGDDLAQHITATFRRTLPALRIASRWLRVNVKYIVRDHEYMAYQVTKRAEGVEVSSIDEHSLSKMSTHSRRFWRSYADFMTALIAKFPISKLPSLTALLEEDVEIKGFLPLKNLTDSTETTYVSGEKSTFYPENAHPNDWQLMRIADLLNDCISLVASQNFPVTLSHGIFRMKDEVTEPDSPRHKDDGPRSDRILSRDKSTERHTSVFGGSDDDLIEETSRTDDDLLREAFDVVYASAEGRLDDEDEIVWDPRASQSPIIAPALPSLPSNPITTSDAPLLKTLVKTSPTKMTLTPFPSHTAISHNAPTTAQDLLNDVLSGRSTRTRLESSAPQPALMFGQELTFHQGPNIWSASREEQSLAFISKRFI